MTEVGNLPDIWKRYKRTFEQFLVSTSKADKPHGVKVALLVPIIGQRGNDVIDSLTWNADADRDKYDTVIDEFYSFCAPRIHVAAMTPKLLTVKRGQMERDDYVTALHNCASDCNNLGGREQYERMTIQALLLDIENDRVRRQLFERQDFSLDETIATCRAMEVARKDLRAVQDTKEETVHSIKPASRRYAKPKKYTYESCRKCGESHPQRKCEA